MRCLSDIAWDKFAFPQTDQEFWREGGIVLPPWEDARHLGHAWRASDWCSKTTRGNTSTQVMLSFLRDRCWSMTHSAILLQWVPVWGVSASLTMMELRMRQTTWVTWCLHPTARLNLVRLPSPEIIKGIPAGAKSNTGSSVMDSRDEWDKMEVRVWSCCPTPTAKSRPHLGRGPRHCAGGGSDQKAGPNLGGYCW